MDNNDLTESLGETILNNQAEIAIDWATFTVDKILESKEMLQIPIVNTIVGIYKISKSLFDFQKFEFIVEFLNGLNNNTISKEKLSQMKELYTNNNVRFKEDMKRLVVILSNSIEKEQSRCLGKIFRAMINQDINYQQYLELSNLNMQLTLSDYKILKDEFNDLKKIVPYNDKYSHLVGLGFVIKEFELDVGNIKIEEEYGQTIIPPIIKHDYYCVLSEVGKIFKRIICNNFNEEKIIS